MKKRTLLYVALMALFCSCENTDSAYGKVKGSKPNIIFILADDLGYGDLGCYGQETISTPHIDRMASEGLRFTQHYAGATVCAPSRNSLMTGQHMGNTTIKSMEKPIKDSDLTVAEVLKDAGYRTGVIGKWGLGNVGTSGYANAQGFDYSFGYYDQIRAHNYYPDYLMENGEKFPLKNEVVYVSDSTNYAVGIGNAAIKKKEYSNDLFTEKALDFIKTDAKEPFFLYLAYTIPHANNESFLINEHGMEVPDYGIYDKEPWPSEKKAGAAMITRLDSYVGQILDLLKKNNLDGNTLVIFTSDNGPHQEGGWQVDYFDSNGPLRGMKRDLYEGGIRVPFIAKWPGKIEKGETDQVATFWDFLPTACELSGQDKPISTDGISYLPTLLGDNEQQKQHSFLYWEFKTSISRHAVRSGDYKLVTIKDPKIDSTSIELYNLADDISEKRNIADQNPTRVSDLEAIINRFR
ncbi:arylsulfatase [Zobellia galactanivorans]|nr:arylsulfatase [Zobellia galactanivorans]